MKVPVAAMNRLGSGSNIRRFVAALVLISASGSAQAISGSGSALPEPAMVNIRFDQKAILSTEIAGEAGVKGRAVTADDPVRVASISKLVVALAVMRLVDQGTLNLDTDVSTYLRWQARNPAFPDTAITLRQLLTHRSGLRDTVDYILPLDGNLPTLLANAQAWEAQYAPGAYFKYANLNSPLIAAIMENATGERFDRLVARLVLKPLNIDACFNWGAGCRTGRRAQAVTLLRTNGDLARDVAITGEDPCPVAPAADGSCDLGRYPLGRHGSAFSPQGGLRIAPAGLVRLGQVMLSNGRPLLSRKAFAEMTRVQWRFDGKNGDDEQGYFLRYGLGVHGMTDNQGQQWLGHVGEAYALRAGFWVNMRAKRGLVRYVTMVPADTAIGHCLESCP
jgi:CubicO group peptidase (beta-lactamase class C family)